MKLNLERPLLFFDIESTGLNIATDSIIELSFVKVFPDSEERIKTWKVCPWDYAAGSLIASETGCLVSDIKGAPLSIKRKSSVLIGRPSAAKRFLDSTCNSI